MAFLKGLPTGRKGRDLRHARSAPWTGLCVLSAGLHAAALLWVCKAQWGVQEHEEARPWAQTRLDFSLREAEPTPVPERTAIRAACSEREIRAWPQVWPGPSDAARFKAGLWNAIEGAPGADSTAAPSAAAHELECRLGPSLAGPATGLPSKSSLFSADTRTCSEFLTLDPAEGVLGSDSLVGTNSRNGGSGFASKNRVGSGASGAPGGSGGVLALGSGIPNDGLHLTGQPDYPRACRAGECRWGSPCEGTGVYLITPAAPGVHPERVEVLTSAGCSKLDASACEFLHRKEYPAAKRYTVRILFQIPGS